MYRFRSIDRVYSQWALVDTETGEEKVVESVEPAAKKWFSGDVLDASLDLVSSPVRAGQPIPGVLVLSGATYGRDAKRRLLYKCIPDDRTLPIFLAPYAHKDIGFSKKPVDRYVVVEYGDWDAKHPVCVVRNNIGRVDENEAFYEYQLYRRGLIIPRPKKTEKRRILEALSAKPVDSVVEEMSAKWGFEDRVELPVITIDPEGCRDYDDAIGWRRTPEGQQVSVYISNVSAWLEHLDKWDVVKGLPATVYLPHRVVPMLLEFLSTNLCSLVEGHKRPVLAMDILLGENSSISVSFALCIIRVDRNYRYEDAVLESNPTYVGLRSATVELQRSLPYLNGDLDSHGLVAFYMIYMNHSVAKILYSAKSGISRTHEGKCSGNPGEVARVIEGYHGGGAKYVRSGGSLDRGHGLVGNSLEHYTHVTSPIRRAVDLANMVVLQSWLGLMTYGGVAQRYVAGLDAGISDLNDTVKKISLVQSDCSMLAACTSNPEVLERDHRGIVIDAQADVETGDTRYTVYLEDLSLLYRIFIKSGGEVLEPYSRHDFSIHMFMDESTLSRKIRLAVSSRDTPL